MFSKIIEFFIKNQRLNYFLFFAIFVAGIQTYNMMPKEIFPPIEMDKISVRGGYTGSSIENLNKMAVIDLEDAIKSIEGVSLVETSIKSGSFTINAEVASGYDKNKILDDVKDAISNNRQNLPSDMNEPVASISERKSALMDISISSKTKTQEELIKKANDLKSELSAINNISEVMIFGDSDKHMLFRLNDKNIQHYNLNMKDVITSLKSLSYIFPIGTIEEQGKENYFISSWNGKKDAKELMNTLITIGDKKLYISDIADVEKKLKDSTNLSTLNAKSALMLRVSKGENGNSIELSNIITKKVEKLNKDLKGEFELGIFTDTSKMVKERLDIVLSNILLGILLVTLSMYLLINKRISFVVGLGIPTAFLIGSVFFYYTGNSINMISLLGVLIAIGILVDDAIIVAENIQRYIEEGYSKIEAAIKGTEEVIMPIIIASITTLFAFFPMLSMSGNIGKFIIMIPIAVILLIIASVIESFIFLPLHAAHVLDKKEPERDWTKVQELYKRILSFFIKWRKSSLIVFFILVPLLIVGGVKQSKFQFFPQYDSTQINISGKLDLNSELEDTYVLLKEIEKDILKSKDKFFIKNTTGKAGFRMTKSGDTEVSPNLLFITIELEDSVPENFIEKYITPYTSIYYNIEEKKRTISSQQIAKILKKKMKEIKAKHPQLIELDVSESKPGLIKSDIQINIRTVETEKLLKTINHLKTILGNMKGVSDISDNATFGNKEIKIKINNYGEKLGLTESYLSSLLSDNFLSNRKSSYFDSDGIFDIIIENKNKDKMSTLIDFPVTIPTTNQKVNLNEVVDFVHIDNFEKMEKEDGDIVKTVYANVDPKIITASEVIEKLQPTFEELNKDGITFKLKGEEEKKKELRSDVSKAFSVAMVFILMALLYMFNSFRVAFVIISVIPLSFLGVIGGHIIMGMNLTMPSIIGALGLAGVVINDGIIMLSFLEKAKNKIEMLDRAKLRLRPIMLTSITTFIGLATLMFFATGQAKIMQPLAISLGFGLAWGTILNLLYVPVLYTFIKKYHKESTTDLSKC